MPLAKSLPLMVSVCSVLLATIEVGLMLLTDGAGAAAGVTVTACVPDEQSAAAVADEERHTRQ